MVTVTKHGILLSPSSLAFEECGVLNPAILQDGNTIHVLYRAVRKGNYSTIGYCKLEGPLTVVERHKAPIMIPEFDYEIHGIEDPRIVTIDKLHYITFTSYDGVNAAGGLATTSDLVHFDRLGVITPQFTFEEFIRYAESNAPLNEKYERFHVHNNIKSNPDKKMLLWDKDVIFFPRRINGKIHFLHRIKPDIQVVAITSITELTPAFWENYFFHLNTNIVLTSAFEHEVSYIGGGCPSIETAEGWLLIYHGVYDTPEGYVYTACAALLDINNPCKEIARLPYALFKPQETFECKGTVKNVVFPTGTALFDDTLYIYYGAADYCIATVSLSISQLLTELLSFSHTQNHQL